MEKDQDDCLSSAQADLLIGLNAFLSESAVVSATSLSRTAIHRKRQAGKFPQPEEISEGRVGYRIRDIKAWLDNPMNWSGPPDSLDI
ncbi:MAG: AlpA family phage regulatory protein [Gammaproteobacteria bacterium]